MPKIVPDFNIGDVVGKLTVIAEIPKYREMNYLLRCECGNEVTRSKSYLRNKASGHCNKGKCKSKPTNTTHDSSHTKLYRVWGGIKGRVNNPTGKNSCYANINICKEWTEDFTSFRDWAEANGYKEGFTIDRIDATKDYSPTNCRWTNWVVQSQNRSKHSKKADYLPKGVYERVYNETITYCWIVIYNGNRTQKGGFTSIKEAYTSRVQYIKHHYDGLVLY